VDDEFHSKMRSDGRFQTLKIGEPIVINSDMSSELINSAVQCGTNLIQAVEQWLVAHPAMSRP
jgi:hypothetical protein